MSSTARVKRTTMSVSGGKTSNASLTAIPAPAHINMAVMMATYGSTFLTFSRCDWIGVVIVLLADHSGVLRALFCGV